MSEYGTLEERVRCKALLKKVMGPEETIPFFKNGMNLAGRVSLRPDIPRQCPLPWRTMWKGTTCRENCASTFSPAHR